MWLTPAALDSHRSPRHAALAKDLASQERRARSSGSKGHSLTQQHAQQVAFERQIQSEETRCSHSHAGKADAGERLHIRAIF